METTAAATPTSLTGAQMPVRVAGSCGCARVAEIFSSKVVQHICVTDDTAEVQQVVRMLEQKATIAKVNLVPFVVSALLCACPSARPPCPLPPLSLPVRMFWPTPTPSPIRAFVRSCVSLRACPSNPSIHSAIRPSTHLSVNRSGHPPIRPSTLPSGQNYSGIQWITVVYWV